MNATGPIRQIVRGDVPVERRYLVVAPGTVTQIAKPCRCRPRREGMAAVPGSSKMAARPMSAVGTLPTAPDQLRRSLRTWLRIWWM